MYVHGMYQTRLQSLCLVPQVCFLIIQLPCFSLQNKKLFCQKKDSLYASLCLPLADCIWLFSNDSFPHMATKTIQKYIFIMWRYFLKFECQGVSYNHIKACVYEFMCVYMHVCVCMCTQQFASPYLSYPLPVSHSLTCKYQSLNFRIFRS